MLVGGGSSNGGASDGATEETLEDVLLELQNKLDDGGTVELGSDTIANILIALETANAPVVDGLNDSLDVLADILLELDQKIEAGDIVGLDAATITALQTISATILNQPTDFPDAATHTKLDSILTDTGDAGTSPPSGSGMLGWLRGIYTAITGTVTVSGPITDTQLRASSVPVTVSDGSGPLTVDGSVSISNFPATQPVSNASLPLPTGAATSAKQSDGTQVTSVNNASGGAAVNVQDGGNSLTVDGTVTANIQGSGNAIIAQAQSADGLVVSASINKLAAIVYQMCFNGSTFDRVRVANMYKTTVATASGDTAVWTPTSGKKFRVMGYQIQMSSNASLAAGAVLEIVLRDGATPIGVGSSVFVPTIAVTTTPGMSNSGWILLSNGFLSSAANNVLNVNLSAALVTGEVRVVVMGTEE